MATFTTGSATTAPCRWTRPSGIIKRGPRGLEHAARRGLIHRDIKPANILLTPEGEAKIADLGLAVQLDEEDERVTRDGTTVGTVDYMAPEQARDSRATSVRSDIYSLGCTFYHILAGVPPFVGGDVPGQAPPPRLRDARRTSAQLRPDVPPALAAIVDRMLAKKPEQRYADYDELLAALDSFRAGGAGEDGLLDAIVVDDEPDAEGVLDAIIDDDEGDFLDEGDVAIGSTFESSTIPDGTAGTGKSTRRESGEGGTNTPGVSGKATSRSGQAAAATPSLPEISLAELAKLDDDGPAPRSRRDRRPAVRLPPNRPPPCPGGTHTWRPCSMKTPPRTPWLAHSPPALAMRATRTRCASRSFAA